MKTAKWWVLVLAVGLALFAGCDDDSSSVDPNGGASGYDFTTILADYSNLVVVSTYETMMNAGVQFNAAVEAYVASPDDQELLNQACNRWVDLREPWESGEAFLFGPAAFLSLDPSLDSWPLDREQLEDILESDLDLTTSAVELLGASVRGFHTAEFLLFREGNPRNVSDVTPREREYLLAVSGVLASDTESLCLAWKEGYDGGDAYANEFTNAGKAGSRYTTQLDAVLQIVDGMSAIVDEVANGKLADPYNEQNPIIVESWHSFNSLDDFANNIRSVQNAYMGGYHNGTDGVGLNEYVHEQDAELDATIQTQIEASITAINQIPHPFRDNLTASAQIEAAMTQLNVLKVTLEDDLTTLLVN